jgi:hypothetical protein
MAMRGNYLFSDQSLCGSRCGDSVAKCVAPLRRPEGIVRDTFVNEVLS